MKEKIRKILLVVCICVFAYSAFQLISIFYNYHSIEEDTNELIQEYVIEDEEEESEDQDPLKRSIDFKKLQERNKDVIGWLYIPDTKIDEPILKGANNDSYLRKDIDKKSNTAGQIFIDEINKKDFKDDNTIIYGHNMKNGSRFHDLRYYVKKDFFNEHQYIYIYLPNNTINVYEVFSSNIIDAYSDLYQKGINYQKYIQNVLKNAKCKRDVSKKQNPLIMLSTCYAHESDDRYVVFARLSENVKISE